MDLRAEMEASCPPEHLFWIVSDLGTYPEWLSIVRRSEPAEGSNVWLVELRGRLGPMARSKQLRMVRTSLEPPSHARFERQEADRREHSPWTFDVRVSAMDAGSLLAVELHYGGSFGGRLLRRMLDEEIEQSRPRLRALAER